MCPDPCPRSLLRDQSVLSFAPSGSKLKFIQSAILEGKGGCSMLVPIDLLKAFAVGIGRADLAAILPIVRMTEVRPLNTMTRYPSVRKLFLVQVAATRHGNTISRIVTDFGRGQS